MQNKVTLWLSTKQVLYAMNLEEDYISARNKFYAMHRRIREKGKSCASENFMSQDFFCNWAMQQKGHNNRDVDGRFWQLDKDIIGDGSFYSEYACCFVPAVLNTFIYKKSFGSGIVVNRGRFVARIRKRGIRTDLIRTTNYKEALTCYQNAKVEYLMELSNEYFDTVDYRVFPSLLLKLTNSFTL